MKQLTQILVESMIPERKKDAYKNNFGHVLLIGGNENMGGAIILAAQAAVHAGAGLVTVATDEHNLHALHSRVPEAMYSDMYRHSELIDLIKQVDTIVIGPGLGRDLYACEILQLVLRHVSDKQSLIIDGDAITLFAQEKYWIPNEHVVFTPHLGEWERLSGLSPEEEEPIKNQQVVESLGATVVLKKSRTEIYFKKDVWQNTTGSPAQATGGMGDTLAGMIGAFAKQFPSENEGVLAAVYLHSWIADELAKKNYVTLPSQIIQRIPQTMKLFINRKHHLPKV